MDRKKELTDILSKTFNQFNDNKPIDEDEIGFGYDDRVLTHIRLEQIILEKQIREKIDTESEEFKNFVLSIKDSGVISPIWLKKIEDGKYLLVAGERRFLAAKEVGLLAIPAVILQKDANVLIYQIVENLQRKDLTNYEKAKAFYEFYCGTVNKRDVSPEHIVSQFQENVDDSFLLGMSKLGISNSVFIRYLKILSFTVDIQKFIKEKDIPVYIVEKLYSYRNNENILDLFKLYLTNGEKALDNYLKKAKKQLSNSKEKAVRYYSKVLHMKKVIEDISKENSYIRDKDKVLIELESLKNLIENLLKSFQNKM